MDVSGTQDRACCSGEDWCAVVCATQVLHGKWHLVLVERLLETPTARFSELERHALGVSGKVLTQSLQHLETQGIVQRSPGPERAYALTAKGRDLQPVVEALRAWGAQHLPGARGGRRRPRGAASPGRGI